MKTPDAPAPETAAPKSRDEEGWPAKPEPRRGGGWTPERRAAQAALIRARKPWLHSTGPRTNAGKAASRDNAVTHGAYRREASADLAVRALAEQRRFLDELRATMRFIRKVEKNRT